MNAPLFNARHRTRRLAGQLFATICFLATAVGIVVLGMLLFDIVRDGAGALSWEFLTSYPSRFAARAGIKPALYGSLWTLVLTALISFPIGVGTAIWLEEYAPNNRFTRVIQMNIANLAGVPSIVYGILGLALFVRFAGMGRSVLAGAFTLALLVLRHCVQYADWARVLILRAIYKKRVNGPERDAALHAPKVRRPRLRCREPFASAGWGNRLCRGCQLRAADMSPMTPN